MSLLTESIESFQGLLSKDAQHQMEDITRIRHLFDQDGYNGMEMEVLKQLVLPRFVKLLDKKRAAALTKCEILNALRSIVSSSRRAAQTFGESVILQLIAQLDSSDVEVRWQTLWTLETISEHRAWFNEEVFYAEDLYRVVQTLREDHELRARRIATRVLKILCKGMRPRLAKRSDHVLPVVKELADSQDELILMDALRALRIFSVSAHDSAWYRSRAIIVSGAFPRLVELLSHNSFLVRKESLIVVSNTTEVDPHYARQILSCGVLSALPPFFSSTDPHVVEMSCRALRNLLRDHHGRSARAIIDANLIPLLFTTFRHSRIWVRSVASEALILAAYQANEVQIDYLISQGIIRLLRKVLATETHLTEFTLVSLKNVLQAGAVAIDDAGRNLGN